MSLDIIMDTGSYVGNGATQSVSIGWQPDFVLIASTAFIGPANDRALTMKFSGMSNGDMMRLTSLAAFLTGSGVTLIADGFDLAAVDSINKTGTTFHWIAIRMGPWFDGATYTGDVASSQQIITGRQPQAVFVAQNEITGNEVAFWTWSSLLAGSYGIFENIFEIFATGLTLISTGFEVSGPKTNANNKVYTWLAMYDLVGATSHLQESTYIGSGAGQSISLGRQPKFVVIMATLSTAGICGFKFDSMSAADYGRLENAYAWDTGGQGITLTADGFDIGTDLDESGKTFYWMAGFD